MISIVLDVLALKVFPLFFLADGIVIPAVCVFGFCKCWVSRGYIPIGATGSYSDGGCSAREGEDA